MAKMSLPIPDKLKKSMFWIVIGVLALMSVIFWWLGTAAVAEMRNKDIGEINGYFAKVNGANPTANAKTVADMSTRSAALKAAMNEAWQRVYDRQLKEPFWPQEELDANGAVLKPGLPQGFVDEAKGLPPAEWLPENRELLTEPLKEIYRNYAKRQIADLCQIVGSVHRIDERRAAAGRQFAGNNEVSDVAEVGEICVWPTASQQNAADLLTFAEGANPSTQDIIYAQGSVWVYQALFNIIKATNESIKEGPAAKDLAHYNAPVKFIHEISIGDKFVVKEASDARRIGGYGSADESDEGAVRIPQVLRRAGLRYVNEHGKRLKNEQLLALEDPDPKTNPNVDPSRDHAQYKLMPVFMRLEVDQRFLGRLLVECANSPLTVEVKDVSFKVLGHADRESANPQDANVNSGPKDSKNFYDTTIDITGHIYVYYPPQKATGDEDVVPGDEVAPADATAGVGG